MNSHQPIRYETTKLSAKFAWDQVKTITLILGDKDQIQTLTPVLPKGLSDQIGLFLTDEPRKKINSPKSISFHLTPETKVNILFTPKKADTFARMSWCRRLPKLIPDRDKSNHLLWIAPQLVEEWTLPCLFGLLVGKAVLPATKKKRHAPKNILVHLCTDSTQWERLTSLSHRAYILAEANTLVRSLAVLPSNQLTPSAYRSFVEETVKQNKLRSEWISFNELKKMGAGAFVAVAQAAHDNGSGILKIDYHPKGAKRHICIVGKGICFDTGGFNLKTGPHMLGMNEDMTGSAVALALCLAISKLKTPVRVTSFLALTENILGPNAYRPNDIVHSLSGKTIEVIDTDAEGRMVLSDTLTLSAKEGPDLIIDFATLTGACVRAIGTNYSGAFSNRSKLFPAIRKAGKTSGERVWPFPKDADYGKCLKSEVADIKQCRPSGGVDHIEASYFLSQFIPKKTPWVHVDLSACENEGGLGAIPTKTTGFGVLFGISLIENFTGP